MEESSVRPLRWIGSLATVLLAASCSLGNPADAGSINVDVSMDKGALPIGEAVVVTVTVRNVGYDPLTLTGPSDCLLYVEVLSAQGDVVWNSNGGCVGSTVTSEILAGDDYQQQFTWTGVNLSGGRLASGYYHVRGVARVTGAAYIGPVRSIALE
jgi:hypothetical protein